MTHIPVLQKEVIEYLDPQPDHHFIDATYGEGGHSSSILQHNGPRGRVLGIERDPQLLAQAKPKERLLLVRGNYAELKSIVAEHRFASVHGIVFDLGMSSWHLEQSGRGFSFLKEEPLDMRYDPEGETAADLLNTASEKRLHDIVKEYGEERFAKKIARAIVTTRELKPFTKTTELCAVIRKAVPQRYHNSKIHYATRTFQALRIAVNHELDLLQKSLLAAHDVLEQGGRLVVISFHSLEDRIVKRFFASTPDLSVLTKKPITPKKQEIIRNPRARSAKLRAAEKN